MSSSSTYVRELYAITEATKKWRQYLLGSTFKIYTYHNSLKPSHSGHSDPGAAEMAH